MGKGYAIKKGILVAKSKWILTCDLDMSVLPEQYLIWKKKKTVNASIDSIRQKMNESL